MNRLTYRDKEGHACWRKELLEDDTGAAGDLIRNTVADYEDKLSAADAVPVVRCRECKHWEDWGACGHTDNGFDSPPMGPDDFCSKGERSTD